MTETNYLCVHCHFYQPPRGNPLSDEPLVEQDAAPFRNWNERITHECYEPNAALGNFDHISFNIGGTLTKWLAEHAPETYNRILEADARHMRQYGMGNAVAQTIHHTILPLASRDDKVTQVRWGLATFEHRFGHAAQGMWLPEMAVDLETLEVLAAEGVEWTILTESQIEEGKEPGAGPYEVALPGERRIKVFVRDEQLSNDIAFNLGRFGGAGRWAREVLVPRRRGSGPLTLIATDGETFGHHWRGEEQFLHWLLNYEAKAAGYNVIALNRYVKMVPSQGEIRIRENTAWSCSHGLARWSTGCSCTPGDSAWKGGVRAALDNVRVELDGVYEEYARRLGVDPLALRNAYIDVVLGRVPKEQFLASRSVEVNEDAAARLLTLLQAQFHRQRMYTSCTFFFPDLDTHSTVYGIANAAYAIKLTREATGTDLAGGFRRDLAAATSRTKAGEPISGADLYDEVLRQFNGW